MTVCLDCNEDKTAGEFYAHPAMANGHVNVCKECHKLRMKNRRRTNPLVQEYDRARSKKADRQVKYREYSKRWRAENTRAYQAHTAVNNAVRDGRLKKLPCEFCGRDDVHAHHKDYSKPLEVIWLCPKCHHRLHAAFPELEGKMKAATVFRQPPF